MYAEVEHLGESDQIIRHASLVKRIAFHLVNRLPPSVQVDDLIQAGMVGLIEASGNFKPSMGASFETFAGIRIRGAMIDEIRRSDWTPRSVHRKFRMVSEAIKHLENINGQDVRDIEVAEYLDITLSEYHQILVDSSQARINSIDSDEESEIGNNLADNKQNTPEAALSDKEYREQLANCIRKLPQKEQLVMSLYYDDELNFREIGKVLEVTESRICQLHGQALLRVKSRMVDWNIKYGSDSD
ncbi:MAG: RNA polymerase sigma factor for flagellar operon FliA [Gammaproteobacteria bacterium]|jgi:RNA polymerase sigma factor for flagellar operon FliA